VAGMKSDTIGSIFVATRLAKSDHLHLQYFNSLVAKHVLQQNELRGDLRATRTLIFDQLQVSSSSNAIGGIPRVFGGTLRAERGDSVPFQ